jgi:zinc protease
VSPVDRSRLPVPGTSPSYRFPEVRKVRLPNGLCVWTVEHRSVPVVTLVLLVGVGSAADPAARPGLASLTGDMLDEGAGDRSALEVHDALARIGASFDTEVGPDATLLTLTTLDRFRQRALRLLADLVLRPRFDPDEFERVRQLRANRLRQLRDLPPALADRAFASLLYGSHPYGHLAIGSEDALQQIALEDVRQYHRRAYRPSAITLVAVGDASHEQLLADASEAFGHWPESDPDPTIAEALARALQPPAAAPARTTTRSCC